MALAAGDQILFSGVPDPLAPGYNLAARLAEVASTVSSTSR
jgi:hypothetical protein